MGHAAFEALSLEGDFPFGVQVLGLKEESLTDPAVRRALNRLWIEKGVIVFRGVTSPDFQIALTKIFGELAFHALAQVRGKDRPELAVARFLPGADMLCMVDDDLRGGWLPWHTDTIYDARIHRGSSLRAIIVPSRLGTTGFIDKIAAYDALPEDLKKRAEAIDVIYKMDFQLDKQRFVTNNVHVLRYPNEALSIHARSDEIPRVLHPAVFTLKDLGRKAFNVSPHPAFGISGMENEAGDALLREIINYGIDESKAYYHDWRPDDMLLWDNWRMLHCDTGSPPDEEQLLERAQIVGDYGLGRLEKAV